MIKTIDDNETKIKFDCKDIVEHVHLITNKEIEIKFYKDLVTNISKENFEVYIDDAKVEKFDFLAYFDNLATLRLADEIYPSENVVKIKLVHEDKTYIASYEPYYKTSDIGSKSKILIRASKDVSSDVVKQVSESINKIVGRTGQMTLEAVKRGLSISIVAKKESVYMVPEYRELYNPIDANTRVTISGTIEKPIIVTTAADVMRERNSDEYAMIYELARLFLELGVKPSSSEDPYNYIKYLQDAYLYAKSNNLWHNSMADSLEEYFAIGTMIYFEVIPESKDGSWQNGVGPVNTRLELKEYDRNLYDFFVDIYGEFEYISPYLGTDYMPWFVGTQPNRFGIDGKPLPKADVVEVNLISSYQIEIKFNRDVLKAADKSKYKVTFIPRDGEELEITDFKVLPYAWNTVTLQFGGWVYGEEGWEELKGPNFLNGNIGTDIKHDQLKYGEYLRETKAEINGEIILEIFGDDIADWNENTIGYKKCNVKLKPYFTKIKRTDKAGVYIYANDEVANGNIDLASRFIDEMLSNETYGQKIADAITLHNAGLSIIPYGKHAYMQPHLRSHYNQYYLYVEGFGNGVAQTTESNLVRDKRVTKYDDEFILGHEFGHTIEMTGIKYGLPELFHEIGEVYERSVHEKGLWPNSYAGSNRNEYFATLTNVWFSTMRESANGSWNGTWGPVNTREELFRYDIDGYNLMKKIYYNGNELDNNKIVYEKNFIGTPWESYTVPNIYDIDGSLY